MGVFTLSHYVILFFLFRYLFPTKDEWVKLLRVLLGVGIIAIIVGIYQRYGDANFLFNMGATRVISTLGNPIFFAGFSLFVFFGSLYSAFVATSRLTRWLSIIAVFFGMYGMVLANSRGTFLGLTLGLLVMLIIAPFLYKDRPMVRKVSMGIFVCLLMASAVLRIFRSSDIIRTMPIVGPLANISFQEHTARTRVLAWQIGVDAWKDAPVFGWGSNNYYYAFNQYYKPEFLDFGPQETWFDNAHNVLINTLVVQGGVGAILYILLFAVGGYTLIRVYRRDSSARVFCLFGLGFLTAHFFHNLFVFENLTSYLYFFFFLAMVDVYAKGVQEAVPALDGDTVHGEKQTIPVAVLAPAILIICAVFYFVNLSILVANNHDYHLRGILRFEGKVDLAIDRLNRAQSWKSPYTADIGWDFSSDVLDLLPKYYYQSESASKELYTRATEAMKFFIQKHPLDVRARLLYADLLRGGMVLYDLDLKVEAEAQLSRAEELSPQRQEVEYARVTYLAGTGDITGAVEKARELIDNNKQMIGPYIALGKVYYLSRQYHLIPEVLDTAIRAGAYPNTEEQDIFTAQAYEREGRFRDALYWYDQAFKLGGREDVAKQRDDLSTLTKKTIPEHLEDFFPFDPAQSPTSTHS